MKDETRRPAAAPARPDDDDRAGSERRVPALPVGTRSMSTRRVPRKCTDSSRSRRTTQLDITLKHIGIDTGSLFFSFNRNPRHFVKNGVTNPKLNWFTDLKFLQAMAHAIDKKAIDRSRASTGWRAGGRGHLAREQNLSTIRISRITTTILKLAARHARGRRLSPRKAGRAHRSARQSRSVFNLTTNTGSPERNQMCTIFKQDLESLGIKVNLPAARIHHPGRQARLVFDWDCILIGFTGGDRAQRRPNFYRSSGNLHIWNPNRAHARDAMGSRDRHTARPGRLPRWIPLSARRTTGGFSKSSTTSCRYSKWSASRRYDAWKNQLEKLSAHRLGPVQAGVDRVQSRTEQPRACAHVASRPMIR